MACCSSGSRATAVTGGEPGPGMVVPALVLAGCCALHRPRAGAGSRARPAGRRKSWRKRWTEPPRCRHGPPRPRAFPRSAAGLILVGGRADAAPRVPARRGEGPRRRDVGVCGPPADPADAVQRVLLSRRRCCRHSDRSPRCGRHESRRAFTLTRWTWCRIRRYCRPGGRWMAGAGACEHGRVPASDGTSWPSSLRCLSCFIT